MQFPIRVKVSANYILPLTTTSANTQFGDTGSTGMRQVRVHNDSTATAFIAFGTTNAAAAVIPVAGALTGSTYASPTPGCKSIAAGSVEIFTTHGIFVAGILASGTGTLYVNECDGI
jgi:hypothetical protein